jgi:hypothetical protein
MNEIPVCFYNLFHIGDAYFMASMLNVLCKTNPNRIFRYYVTVGDAFFSHITNLHRINYIPTEYHCKHVNGMPPECLVGNSVAYVIQTRLQEKGYGPKHRHCIINCEEVPVLFVNTWSPAMEYGEFRYDQALGRWEEEIIRINEEFSLDLKFNVNADKDMLYQPIKSTPIPDVITSTTLRTKFIYNFVTRSVPSHPILINVMLSSFDFDKNLVIVPFYNDTYPTHPNIKYGDRDFGIVPDPKCSNLLDLWNIAKCCDDIYILPCGATWLMFDKDIETMNRRNCVYMIDSPDYIVGLNKSIKYFTGNEDVIKNITICQHSEADATDRIHTTHCK